MLDDLFDYCFPILDKIGHKLDSVEDDMFERRAEDVVRDLSNVKQEIISYRKIIKPERTTLRLLERRVERFLPEELDLYFDDIVDGAERIWDLLDNYKEVVEGLESTNESVISHRQNDVLRVLTVFSAILLPLTLLASVFGMNVDFPGFGTATAFWIVVGAMIAVGGRPARLLPLEALDLSRTAGTKRLRRTFYRKLLPIGGPELLAGARLMRSRLGRHLGYTGPVGIGVSKVDDVGSFTYDPAHDRTQRPYRNPADGGEQTHGGPQRDRQVYHVK